MLAVIRIKNFAIVEEIELEFKPGLNVITGETGAGKSIVLKAIGLLTGRRASADIVRSGAEQCVIEGLFTLAPPVQTQIAAAADEAAELFCGEELIVRRIVDRSGRTKNYVNGSLVTAALLQAIAVPLLDMTGQHEHQRLLEPAEHLAFLDQFGVAEALRTRTAEAYGVYARARNALDQFLLNSRERLLHYETIKEELAELERAAISENERSELETELKRLANFESLSSNVNSSLMLLEEEENGIETKLRRLSVLLNQSSAMDAQLEETCTLVEAACAQLAEARIGLSDYGSGLDCEPGRLEFLRERIAEIARLERKYRKTGSELLVYQQSIRSEIAEIEAQGFDERRLEENLAEAESRLRVLERELSAERQTAALQLASAVEIELAQLNMKRARFKAEVLPAASGPHGADSVQFMLAANPGEPFLPLQKVASGGELSRILLVLKTLLTKQTGPATQIFDEIDSGIGGMVAQVVGEKLKRIAAGAQVILVTHAPQIAAFADTHFAIAKTAGPAHTSTSVTVLDGQRRVQHIAAMLAGKQVTANFEDSARQLLVESAALARKTGTR